MMEGTERPSMLWPSAAESETILPLVIQLTALLAIVMVDAMMRASMFTLPAVTSSWMSFAVTPSMFAARFSSNACCAAASNEDKSPPMRKETVTTSFGSEPGRRGGGDGGSDGGEDGGGGTRGGREGEGQNVPPLPLPLSPEPSPLPLPLSPEPLPPSLRARAMRWLLSRRSKTAPSKTGGIGSFAQLGGSSVDEYLAVLQVWQRAFSLSPVARRAGCSGWCWACLALCYAAKPALISPQKRE